MTTFDIEIDMASTQEALDDLKDKWETDRMYVVGTNVEYAIYLERGTRDMPPYPFFGPGVREFEANPTEFIENNTGFTDIDQIPDADTMVKAVAQALESQITDNASATNPVSRSPGTDSEHPQRQSGNLAASIQAVRIR